MCPNCKKYSLCTCSNCTKRREGKPIPEGILEEIILDREIGVFKCPYCAHVYHAIDGDDAEMEMIRQNDSKVN